TRERRFRPKLPGSLLLALLAGFRFRGLVVLLVFARLVSRFFLLRTRSFNLDLRVIRQGIATRSDDRVSGIHATRHLRKLRVMRTDLDGLNVRMAIRSFAHNVGS